MTWVRSTFEGEENGGEAGPATARVALRGAATLELSSPRAWSRHSAQAGGAPLPAFLFGPITVTPHLQFRLHVAASADAAGRVSIVAPFQVSAGFRHDGATQAGLPSRPRFTPEVGLPGRRHHRHRDRRARGGAGADAVDQLGPARRALPVHLLRGQPGHRLASGFDIDAAVEIGADWVFPDPITGLPSVPDEIGTLFGPFVTDIDDGTGPLQQTSTRWSRVFDINDDDPAVAVVAGGDLTVLQGGDRIGDFPWLASLDDAGIPIRQGIAVDLWDPNDLVRATDGGLIAAGTSGGSIRVDRFDATGAPVWTRTMRATGADTTVCRALVASADGEMILAGEFLTTGVSTPLVLALTGAGDVAWAVGIDPGPGASAADLHGIGLTPAGEVLVVGEVDFAETPAPPELPIDRENALVVRMLPDGTVLSGFALGGTASESATTLAVLPDSSYVIGGHIDSAPHTWLASIRADHTLRWSASYQSRPDVDDNSEFADFLGLSPVRDVGLLLCGRIGTPDEDAFAIRVDAEGVPIWVKTYLRVGSHNDLADVVALDDGMAAVGFTQLAEGGGFGDLWVIRTNVDGMLHFTEDSGLSCVNTAVQWQRRPEDTIRPLAPEATPVTMDVDPVEELLQDEADAFGVLVTD